MQGTQTAVSTFTRQMTPGPAIMKRLKSWLRRKLRTQAIDEYANLPFSEAEFARLLRSGSATDMKIIANGLALHRATMRRATNVAG
jgi:hypothetical protein